MTYWCIKKSNGELWHTSISILSERASFKKLSKSMCIPIEGLKRLGYKAVKVEIKEIKS